MVKILHSLPRQGLANHSYMLSERNRSCMIRWCDIGSLRTDIRGGKLDTMRASSDVSTQSSEVHIVHYGLNRAILSQIYSYIYVCYHDREQTQHLLGPALPVGFWTPFPKCPDRLPQAPSFLHRFGGTDNCEIQEWISYKVVVF